MPRAHGGWLELRAETTESVTGSSGGGLRAPPPDLEVARRRTRSRPEPARPGARPGGTLVLDASAAVRPAQPRDRRPAARARPDTRPSSSARFRPGDVLVQRHSDPSEVYAALRSLAS